MIESVIPGTVGLGLGSGSSWTICIELQLYMLFPIIGPLLKRLSRWQWGAVILGSLCIAAYDNSIIKNALGNEILGKIYNISCIPYIYIFLIGAFAYEYRENVIPFLQKKIVLYLSGIAIVIMELQQRINGKMNGGYSPLATILIACIVFGVAYSYSCSIKIDLSYGIYLWHMIVINLLLLLQIKGYLGIILSILLSLIFAIGTYYIIELPSKNIKEQIININRRYDETSSS